METLLLWGSIFLLVFLVVCYGFYNNLFSKQTFLILLAALILFLLVFLVLYFTRSKNTGNEAQNKTNAARSIKNQTSSDSRSRALQDLKTTGSPAATPAGVPADYLQFLGNLPATLVNYFVTNFANIDLSSFGVPGPSSGVTRGPLNNINISGEVGGTFDIPILGTGAYAVNNIQGLQNLSANIQPINTFAYGLIDPLSAYWNYAPGLLHLNTTVTLTVPKLEFDVNLNISGCGDTTATLSNVVLTMDLGIDYLPELNLIKNIQIEMNPLKYPASQTTGPTPAFSVSFDDFTFSCDNPFIGKVIDVLAGNVFSNKITTAIGNSVPGALLSIINNALGSYNSFATTFLQQYNIIDSKFNVLVTDINTVAEKLLTFLQAIKVNPFIIIALSGQLAQGINSLQLLFQWRAVSYGCQQDQYDAGTGTSITYNTGSVQPYIQPYSGPFTTRADALSVCPKKQFFDCNAAQTACIATANGPFTFDPANGNYTELYNCGQKCVNYSCRISDNACVPAYNCNESHPCYEYKTKSTTCDNKCPAYNLLPTGCTAAFGGQFLEPTCGKGNTGVCVISQGGPACYPTYPSNDGAFVQGSAITAEACAYLGTMLNGVPPTFIPGGTCTTTQCIGMNCVGSSIPCQPFPLGPTGQLMPWTQAYCLKS